MAVAFIKGAANIAESVTSAVLSHGSVGTVGNKVIVMVASKNTTTPTVTGMGITWTKLYTGVAADNSHALHVFIGIPVSGTTITVGNISPNKHAVMASFEYSGLAKVTQTVRTLNTGNSGTATTTATASGPQLNLLHLLLYSVDRGTTFSNPSGWTERVSGSCVAGAGHISGAGFERIVSSGVGIGAISTSLGVADEWTAQAVIFAGQDTITADASLGATSTVTATARIIRSAAGSLSATSTLPALTNRKFTRRADSTVATTSTLPPVVHKTSITVSSAVTSSTSVAGNTEVTSAALALVGLDISGAEGDGGGKFVIRGTIPTAGSFRVHVGPTGTSVDKKAHSGKPGQPDPTSKDGKTLTAYLPELAPGTYNVFITNGTLEASLPNSISIVKANYRSGAFGLRSAFSPFWAVGPRSIDRVPT